MVPLRFIGGLNSEDHLPGDPRHCRGAYFFSAITALSLFPSVPPLFPTRPRGPAVRSRRQGYRSHPPLADGRPNTY